MATTKRDQLKKFYILHSWVGVITGILLFVIAFTGAVSVFARPDIKLWANESLHQPSAATPEIIAELIHDAVDNTDKSFHHEIHAFLPGPRVWTNLVLILEQDHDEDPEAQALWLEYHPQTLELVKRWQGNTEELFEQRSQDISDFIGGFHADLHLGRVGLILTGLLGLTLMASIATGLFIHRKILKELFSFRPDRSLRLLLTDTHKVISVWGLLFHSMIGFTGAFLGLATVLLVPAAAFVSFAGDQEKLLETLSPEVYPVLSATPADMQVQPMLEQVYNDQELEPFRISIYGWGDKNAVGFVDGINPERMPRENHKFQMSNAEPLETTTRFETVGGASGQILDVIYPLHFGNFGGVPLRILWAVLGLSTSLIALTGMMIWVERRAYGAEGNLAPHHYLHLSRLTIGSCAGLVLACSSLFVFQRLTPQWAEEGFFAVWAIALILSQLRKNEYQTCRFLLGASSVSLLLLPLVDALTLERHLFNNFSFSHFTAMSLSLLALGIGLGFLAKRLPKQRPESQIKTQKHNAAQTSFEPSSSIAIEANELDTTAEGHQA